MYMLCWVVSDHYRFGKEAIIIIINIQLSIGKFKVTSDITKRPLCRWRSAGGEEGEARSQVKSPSTTVGIK